MPPADKVDRIVIERQIMLPWRQSLHMCKQSVFVRLGRSVITAAGIFLGVTFLTSVLTSTAILRGQQALDPSVAARNVWLVVMSLMVATVGIVNSMLMSVTERYKEIGTMKCLGALDKFVVRLFLIESFMLGTLGSAAGALVGSGAMALLYLSRWGTAAFANMGPALVIAGAPISLFWAVIMAIVLGGLLSVIAALYPAWRAAKMPPAAALRSEI